MSGEGVGVARRFRKLADEVVRDPDGESCHTGSGEKAGARLLGLCAWCGVAQPVCRRGACVNETLPPASSGQEEPRAVTHGICDSCYEAMLESQVES